MSLTLQQVFDKVNEQKDPRLGLVKDGSIFYLVLNNGENTFNFEIIAKFNALLDEIEASTGPAVLVTIGTGTKRFSTGFDLKFWAKELSNPLISISSM